MTRIIVAALLGGFAVQAVQAELVEFEAGTPAKASEVNSNFQELENRIRELEALLASASRPASIDKAEAIKFNGVWEVELPSYTITCEDGHTATMPALSFTRDARHHDSYNRNYLGFGRQDFNFDGGKREFLNESDFFDESSYSYFLNHGTRGDLFYIVGPDNYVGSSYSMILKFDANQPDIIKATIDYPIVEYKNNADDIVRCSSDATSQLVFNKI